MAGTIMIGLSGWARTGKDSVAGILDWEHGFERDAFANTLREALEALDPIVGADHWDDVEIRLSEVLRDVEGWEGVKDSLFADEVRGLLQRLGTDAGRNLLGEDIWVNALIDRHFDAFGEAHGVERLVISDVRFPNEADTIRAYGGYIWRVKRPTVQPANGHSSESAMDDYEFDAVIYNDGDLFDLSRRVKLALTGIV